jgi:hypothetical protein
MSFFLLCLTFNLEAGSFCVTNAAGKHAMCVEKVLLSVAKNVNYASATTATSNWRHLG